MTNNTNKQTRQILTSVLDVLPDITLAQGGYARDINNKPVGLHSITAARFDLPALIMQACEILTPDDQGSPENEFKKCWLELRSFLRWDRKKNNNDASLCRFLDDHDKDWHLMVVRAMVLGEEYQPLTGGQHATKRVEVELMNEYQ